MTDQGGLSFGPDYIMMTVPSAFTGHDFVIIAPWPLDSTPPDGWTRCYTIEFMASDVTADVPITDAPSTTSSAFEDGPVSTREQKRTEWLREQSENRPRDPGPLLPSREKWLDDWQRDADERNREARARATKPSDEVVFGSSILRDDLGLMGHLKLDMMAREAEASAELAGVVAASVADNVHDLTQEQRDVRLQEIYAALAEATNNEERRAHIEALHQMGAWSPPIGDQELQQIHEEIEREAAEEEETRAIDHEFSEFPPGHVLETQWEEDHTEGYNEEVGEIEFGIIGEDDLPEEDMIPAVEWHNDENGADDYRPTPKLDETIKQERVFDGKEDWDVFEDHRAPTEYPTYEWASPAPEHEQRMTQEIFEDLALPGLRGTKFSREDASKISHADWQRARVMVRALIKDARRNAEREKEVQERARKVASKVHGVYTELGMIAFKLSELMAELDPEDIGSIERQLDETISIP